MSARVDSADLPRRAAPRTVGRLVEQPDMEAAVGCGWWETDTAALVVGFVSAGSVAEVFSAIGQLLREGEDPDVIVGAASAEAALGVAEEWLDAGVEPSEVDGWLRAGCWKPTAARALTDAGVRPWRPWRLLDDDGRPLRWIDVSTPDGEQVPLARAVAEEFMTVETAVLVVIEGAL